MSAAASPTLDLQIKEYARVWASSLAAGAQRVFTGVACDLLTQAPLEAGDHPQDVWIGANWPGEVRFHDRASNEP